MTEIKLYPYIAGYKGKKYEFHAASLFAARTAAETHFKPSKKDQGLLWVELASEEPKNYA